MLHEYGNQNCATSTLSGLGQIAGPVWKDECNHSPEDYVCSFEVLEQISHRGEPTRYGRFSYDLYVYKLTYSNSNSHLCIRFGNKGNEYYSPTSIIETALSAHLMPVYSQALRLMQGMGIVTFHKQSPRGDL